jgi:hypothetical protein
MRIARHDLIVDERRYPVNARRVACFHPEPDGSAPLRHCVR